MIDFNKLCEHNNQEFFCKKCFVLISDEYYKLLSQTAKSNAKLFKQVMSKNNKSKE